MKKGDRYSGVVLTTGSAGTIGCGDYMKKIFPTSKIAAGEAWQCPTLLLNGFGGHRIEGIGDKHVPWIHNVRNTDLVIDADDENCMNIIRLFNEPVGRKYLQKQGVSRELTDKLGLIGISGVGNILCSIKFAKWYELTERDIVLTVLTDSMELYGSRIKELKAQFGEYKELDAARDYHRYLMALTTDRMLELSFQDRKRVHNLKYYTWIEQQGRELSELNEQWYRFPAYWEEVHNQVGQIDELINEFNDRTGLLKNL